MRRFVRRFGDDEALMPEEDWEEDDEDDPMVPKDLEDAKLRIEEHTERVRKEMESTVKMESEDHFKKRLDKESFAKEARLESFLADPEFSMKVFFLLVFQGEGHDLVSAIQSYLYFDMLTVRSYFSQVGTQDTGLSPSFLILPPLHHTKQNFPRTGSETSESCRCCGACKARTSEVLQVRQNCA